MTGTVRKETFDAGLGRKQKWVRPEANGSSQWSDPERARSEIHQTCHDRWTGATQAERGGALLCLLKTSFERGAIG